MHSPFSKWHKIKTPLLNHHLGDWIVQKKTRDKVTGEIFTEIPHTVLTSHSLRECPPCIPKAYTFILAMIQKTCLKLRNKKGGILLPQVQKYCPSILLIQETNKKPLAQHSPLGRKWGRMALMPREAAHTSTPSTTQRNSTSDLNATHKGAITSPGLQF